MLGEGFISREQSTDKKKKTEKHSDFNNIERQKSKPGTQKVWKRLIVATQHEIRI